MRARQGMPTSSLLDSAVLSEADATSPRFGWKTDRMSDGHGGLDETGRPVGDVSAWLFVVQSSNSMVCKLPLLYPHRVLTRITSWASPFSLYSHMILLMFFCPPIGCSIILPLLYAKISYVCNSFRFSGVDSLKIWYTSIPTFTVSIFFLQRW